MIDLQVGAAVTPSVRLVRRLGAGGMGSVWLADHKSLRTQVVVKFMAAELATSVEAVERFSREAAAAAQVKSPHVVQMLDHGVTAEGIPYIIMELLEGQDLGKHLAERGRLSLPETSAIIGQVCKALARAHERGIVHRDIKPDNIFLCSAGDGETLVKLLDFGIAKGDARLGLSSGTQTGAMIGTPYYMSPEQIVGAKTLDFRTDLWALGVVAYECVVGAKPFDEDVFGALAIRIHSGPIPVPSAIDPSLPSGFDAWFAKACARDLAIRFASAKELGSALASVAASVDPAANAGPLPRPLIHTVQAPATPAPGLFPLPDARVVPNTPQHFESTAAIPGLPPAGSMPGPTGGVPRPDLHAGTHGGIGLATLPPRPSALGGAKSVAALVGVLAVLAAVGMLALKRSPSVFRSSAVGAPIAAPSAATMSTPPAAPASTREAPGPRAEPSASSAPEQPAAAVSASAADTRADSPAPPGARPSKGKPAAVAPATARAQSAAAAASAAKPTVDCNPPYFFDDKGNRVFKPECL